MSRRPSTSATGGRHPVLVRKRSALLAGVAAAAATVTLVTACTGTDKAHVAQEVESGGAPAAGDPGASAGGAAAPDSTPSTTARPPTGSGNPITLAFAGDASFEDLTGAVKSNTTGLMSAITPTLSGADFAMVNLETSLGTTGTPVAKSFTFQVPPEAIDSLKASGVDAVSMANNHGMDYGPTGLSDTLAIKARTGFPILGIGNDENEAYAPLITEIKGQRLGVIAANDVFDAALASSWTAGPGKPGIASAEEAHQQRLVTEVTNTRPKVDTLVVYLHYGTEKETCPNARQKELVTALTAAGADIVVGSHAHRLQGVGYQGRKLVAYGLSNFVFRGPSAESRKTGVLMVTATGQQIDGFEWKPATLQNNLPVPQSGAAATAALAEMDQRQACAGLTDAPT